MPDDKLPSHLRPAREAREYLGAETYDRLVQSLDLRVYGSPLGPVVRWNDVLELEPKQWVHKMRASPPETPPETPSPVGALPKPPRQRRPADAPTKAVALVLDAFVVLDRDHVNIENTPRKSLLDLVNQVLHEISKGRVSVEMRTLYTALAYRRDHPPPQSA
jgi:hypothetical protein